MSAIQLCRTCLAHNTRMYTIADTPLEYFYKNITDLTLNTQERPSVVCYICYHLLKKCHRFAESAIRAAEVLQQTCNSGNLITEQQINVIDKSLLLLRRSTVTHVNTTSAVSESIQVLSVTNENYEFKMENDQENMAIDASEFSEDIYQEQEVTMHFEIKKEKELEERQYRLQHISDLDDTVMQSINNQEFENIENESVQEIGVQGSQDTPRPGKRKLKQATKSPKRQTVPTSNENVMKSSTNSIPEDWNDTIKFEITEEKTIDGNSLAHKKRFNNKFKKQKAFSCDVCGNAYTFKCNLSRHLRTHFPTKPPPQNALFICGECGQKCRDNYQLTHHSRTHTQYKPYKCHFCRKSFVQKHNLIRHLRIHTGEKPYSCDNCEKKFAQKNDLTLHIRNHTNERPYSCNLCDNKFKQKGCLTIHVKRHHKT